MELVVAGSCQRLPLPVSRMGTANRYDPFDKQRSEEKYSCGTTLRALVLTAGGAIRNKRETARYESSSTNGMTALNDEVRPP